MNQVSTSLANISFLYSPPHFLPYVTILYLLYDSVVLMTLESTMFTKEKNFEYFKAALSHLGHIEDPL